MPSPVKSLPLSSGASIPWLAYGTGTALFQQDCTAECIAALRLGFRHIDAAQFYANEASVGKAIAHALAPRPDGLGLTREELFVTTKLGMLGEGESVEGSLKGSLEKLGVEYVDLFLVHVPVVFYAREGGVEGVWKEMVGVKEKGLAKSVGVSNFNRSVLEKVIALGVGKPEVNQVCSSPSWFPASCSAYESNNPGQIEYHPLVSQKLEPLLQFSRSQGILTASYGGLTPILPSRATQNSQIEAARARIQAALETLAKARSAEVTPNQIMLKWLQKKGVLAVTTSSKESRMREYLEAEGLPDLSDEEEKAIADACGDAHFRTYVSVVFRSAIDNQRLTITNILSGQIWACGLHVHG